MPKLGTSSNPRRIHTVDNELSSDGKLLFGKENVNGTWKVIRNNNDLKFYCRESGSYVYKGGFTTT